MLHLGNISKCNMKLQVKHKEIVFSEPSLASGVTFCQKCRKIRHLFPTKLLNFGPILHCQRGFEELFSKKIRRRGGLSKSRP